MRSPGGDVLEARGQRAVRDFDAEEFELVLVMRARQAVGPQQGLAADLEADHHELSALVAKRSVAGRLEAEERLGPVPDVDDVLFAEAAHVSIQMAGRRGGCKRSLCKGDGRFSHRPGAQSVN
jgi:hypothetical protein